MGPRFHTMEPSYYRPAQLPAPTPSPTGFMICPLVLVQGLSHAQLALYQIALAEAQAVARPSLPERDLLAVWN